MCSTIRRTSDSGHKLALAVDDKARGRGLDILLQPRRKLGLAEARRDRVEDFGHNGPGIAHERAPRPEQPGVERDRETSDAGLAIEMRNAEFVARLCAG